MLKGIWQRPVLQLASQYEEEESCINVSYINPVAITTGYERYASSAMCDFFQKLRRSGVDRPDLYIKDEAAYLGIKLALPATKTCSACLKAKVQLMVIAREFVKVDAVIPPPILGAR